MAHGTIATLTDRGFGFICPATGDADVFFHRTVLEAVHFDELRPGDAVTYTLGADRHRAGVRAVAVRRDADAGRDDPSSADAAHAEG